MSKSKKILNRLDKLFDNIQPSDGAPDTGIESRPAESAEPRRQQRPQRRAVDEPKSQVLVAESPKIEMGRLAFPFRAGDSWNLIEVADDEKQTFLEDEHLLVQQVADQLSLALQNAQLFQRTEQQASELALLNQYGRELATALDIKTIGKIVYHYTSQLMDAASFFIGLYDEARKEISFPILTIDGIPTEVPNRKLGNALTDWVLRNRQPLLIPDNLPAKRQELGLDIVMVGNDKPALCWLGVPILLGEKVLGAVVVQSVNAPNLYNERHRDLLVALASQAAIAIQNARFFEETRQRASQLETLNEMGRLFSQQIELKGLLTVAYEQLKNLISLDAFIVTFYNEDTKMLTFPMLIDEGVYYDEPPAAFSLTSNTGQVIISGKPSLLLHSQEEYEEEKKIQGTMGNVSKPSASLLFVPLKSGQKTIGVLSAQSYTLNAYSQGEVSLVENVANQLSISIQNARLFEETRTRAEQLSVLNDLSRSLSSLLDETEIVKVVYDGIVRLIGAKNFYLAMYDEKTNEVVFTQNVTLSKVDSSITRLPMGTGITSHIIRTGEPVFIKDGTDKWLINHGVEPSGEPAQSFLGVPLLRGNHVLGAMAIQDYQEENAYDENDQQLFLALASQISIALENARLFNQTQGRARRERILREITARVRNTNDPSIIIKTAVREIGEALGLKAFIKLGDAEQLKKKPDDKQPPSSTIEPNSQRLPRAKGEK